MKATVTVGELDRLLRERNLELRLDFFAGEWTATLLHQGMVRVKASNGALESAILKALGSLS